jgi:ATP-dependent exoDNAse (exonuclease V) alpha subunit
LFNTGNTKLATEQFPVKLCFAMTINKVQGQSLENVGIDLRKYVCSYGYLYVAFSRATNPKKKKLPSY